MNIINQTADYLNLTIPGSLEEIESVDSIVNDWMQQEHISVEPFAVRIAMREALLNAVLYGCCENPDCAVSMEILRKENELVMTIRDPGQGFDWRQHSGPPEDLLENGRGLALMHMYMEKVQFNEIGNQVTLHTSFKKHTLNLTAQERGEYHS